MNREQIEIERKYDVAAQTALPDLTDAGATSRVETGAPVSLDAVYLDTAEHLLLAHRITLRRREGGSDAGWHVKLPESSGARREVHAPLGAGDEEVPQELRNRLEVLLRGRPLAAVLRLATTRTATTLYDADDVALAEVADDEVVATNPSSGAAHAWREWEVELAPGLTREEGEALFDAVEPLLEAAGASPSSSKSKLARGLAAVTQPLQDAVAAPLDEGDLAAEPGTAGTFLADAVTGLTAELVRLDPAVRDGADDAVHRFRTILRRLRTVLRVYRGVLDADAAKALQATLTEIGTRAGEVRDAEVAEQQLAADAALAPDGFVPFETLQRIRAAARERAEEARQRLVAALGDTAYFELLDRLDAIASAGSGPEADRSVEAFAAERVDHAAKQAGRRVRAAVDAVVEGSAGSGGVEFDRVVVHRARKAARRLRHAIDAKKRAGFGGGSGRKTARAIQSALGTVLDAEAAATTYRLAAEAARRAEEDTFGYGVLAVVALRRRDEALARLPRLARKL